RAATDDTSTIAPPLHPRLVDMRRTASRQHRKDPTTFAARTRELPVRGLEQPDHVGLDRDVCLNGDGLAPGAEAIRCDRVRRLPVADVVDADRVASPCREPAGGRADAPGPARYDDDLSHSAPSIDRPEAGGDQLEQVLVRVAEVKAPGAARPAHGALESDASPREPFQPRLDVFGRDREGQVAPTGNAVAGDHAPRRAAGSSVAPFLNSSP